MRATSGDLGACQFFKIEYSEMLIPAFPEPKNQFPIQGRSSLKFSLRSTILNEIGQLVRKQGGGNGSKFISCLSKKNYDNEKNKENPSNISIKELDIGWQMTG